MTTGPSRRSLLRAFMARDESCDGLFLAAVTSTRIFCRLSCPARRPSPRRVVFFAAKEEALAAGYRPCRRCRPTEADGAPPSWARRLLRVVESSPRDRIRDRDLRALGIDPARARRFFRRTYGMTFLAYARSRRLGEALEQMRAGSSLDDAALGNGFESHSGFRSAFGRTFGRPPGRGRESACAVTQVIQSPLGPLLAAATPEGVCMLEFGGPRASAAQLEGLRRALGCAVVPGRSSHLDLLRAELDAYFAGRLSRFSVPLVLAGTPFQRRVWEALVRIPFGATISYEELARSARRPGACRAAGSANGRNRIVILVPCHRVVNKSGALGGYGGGLWRKRALLELERSTAAPAGRRMKESA